VKTTDLIESLALQPAAVPRSPWGLVLVAMGLTGLLLFGLGSVYGYRPELWDRMGEPWFGLNLGLLLLSAMASLVVSCLIAVPHFSLTQRLRLFALLPFVLWSVSLAVSLVLTLATNPESIRPEPWDLFCVQNFMVFLLLPGAFFLFQIRKLAPTQPRWSSGLAVLAATSMGNFSLLLLEQQNSIFHQIVCHWSPTMMFVLLGFCCGKKMLRW